jgi:hypothetical protein
MEDIAAILAKGEADTTAISSFLKTSKGKALAKAIACNTYKTNTVSEKRGVAIASALLMAMRDTDEEILKEPRFNTPQGTFFCSFY